MPHVSTVLFLFSHSFHCSPLFLHPLGGRKNGHRSAIKSYTLMQSSSLLHTKVCWWCGGVLCLSMKGHSEKALHCLPFPQIPSFKNPLKTNPLFPSTDNWTSPLSRIPHSNCFRVWHMPRSTDKMCYGKNFHKEKLLLVSLLT